MRKGVLAFLVACSVGGFFLNPASAAVKAGTACTKINQSTVASGYVYICLKSGKKLIWVRGVKIPAPIPSRASTPTPTSTPALMPTPTPTSTMTSAPVPVSTPIVALGSFLGAYPGGSGP